MKVTLKRTSPNYRQKLSTYGIMRDLTLALLVLVAYSIGTNFVNYGQQYGVKAILIYVVAVATALITEVVYAKIREKETKVSIGKHIKNSFPIVTALIYALTLPIGSPLYVVAIGAFIAIFFGKLVFGGFGQNIFNPALVGRVVVHLSFSSKLLPYLESNPVDALTGATPAAAYAATNWVGKIDFSLSQIFFGNHGGTLGETYTFLIIILGVVLAFRKVFDARITLSYVITCFILALIVGFNSVDNAFMYAIAQLCIGGLAFGAVFMLTDPVTSPTSPLGKILFGMSAGFITMLIRFKGNYPEGVLFSILIMNMLTPWLDRITVGNISANIKKQVLAIGLVLILAVSTTTVIANNLKEVVEEPGGEKPSGEEKEPIYLVEEVPGGYLISSEGFGGSAKPMQIEVLISGNTITSVDVVNYEGETEYYGQDLIEIGTGGELNDKSQAFFDTLLSGTIDPNELDGIDTETGATMTANGILEAVKFAWNLVPKKDADGNTIHVVEANGFNTNNPMILHVVVYPDNSISAEVVNYPGETEDYGKDLIESGVGAELNSAAQTFHDAIFNQKVNVNELDSIDTTTGATMTANGILDALKSLAGGGASSHLGATKEGVLVVKGKGFGGKANPIYLQVEINDGVATKVEVVKSSGETAGYGADLITTGEGSELNSNALSFYQTIFGGNLTSAEVDGVDTVTGATMSADGIVEALKKAFEISK